MMMLGDVATAGAWAATDAQRMTQDVAAATEAAPPPMHIPAEMLIPVPTHGVAAHGALAVAGCAGVASAPGVVSGSLGVSATVSLLLPQGPSAGPANTVTRPKHRGVVNNFGTPELARRRLKPEKAKPRERSAGGASWWS
jgi:hypothetical protein